MVTLSIKAIEKWSKTPIPEALVYVNDKYVDKTDDKGELSIDMTMGSAKIEARKAGFEDYVQSLVLAANVVINVIMTPEVRAL